MSKAVLQNLKINKSKIIIFHSMSETMKFAITQFIRYPIPSTHPGFSCWSLGTRTLTAAVWVYQSLSACLHEYMNGHSQLSWVKLSPLLNTGYSSVRCGRIYIYMQLCVLPACLCCQNVWLCIIKRPL